MAVYTLLSSQSVQAANGQGLYCNSGASNAAVQLTSTNPIKISAILTVGTITTPIVQGSGHIIVKYATYPVSGLSIANAVANIQDWKQLEISVPPVSGAVINVSSESFQPDGQYLYAWVEVQNMNVTSTLTVYAVDSSSYGVVNYGAEPSQTWQYGSSTAVTNTSDVALKAAVAGQRNYCAGLQLIGTNTTATVVVVKDGSTVIWAGYCPATGASLQAQSQTFNFETPLRGSVNTALNFACITTGANVYVSAQGYTAL